MKQRILWAILLAIPSLAAAGFTSLPLGPLDTPAHLRLWRVAWHQPLAERQFLEWHPREPGGAGIDPRDGTAVVGTRDGALRAISPRGQVLWEFRAAGRFLAPPRISGDTVYAGCGDGRLYALDLARGTERWRYDTQEEVGTTPVLGNGLVYVSSLQDTLFAVDAKSGAWKWHHRREPTGSFTIRGAAGPVLDGDSIYTAYSDGYVAALDAQSGAPRWQKRIAPSGQFIDVDALHASDGRLFVAAYSGAVYALEAKDGQPAWEAKIPFASRLAVTKGTLVVVAVDRIHGLSPDDGAILWSTPFSGVPTADPVGHRTYALVSSGTGVLWLDITTGQRLRVFDPGTGVSAPVALKGNRAYVLSNGGELYALDLL
jgi:outer membrane protein assembly factor BamB